MTVWAVLVPEALAYATIAGGSPVVLVLARQVGQVRDILATERHPTAIEIYPSVRAAVDAVTTRP